YVLDQRVDAAGPGRPEQRDLLAGQAIRAENPGPESIGDVMVDVGHPVDQPYDLAFQRNALFGAGVLEDPLSDRLIQVEAAPLPLQHVDHPERVDVVLETGAAVAAAGLVQRLLADVAERRV